MMALLTVAWQHVFAAPTAAVPCVSFDFISVCFSSKWLSRCFRRVILMRRVRCVLRETWSHPRLSALSSTSKTHIASNSLGREPVWRLNARYGDVLSPFSASRNVPPRERRALAVLISLALASCILFIIAAAVCNIEMHFNLASTHLIHAMTWLQAWNCQTHFVELIQTKPLEYFATLRHFRHATVWRKLGRSTSKIGPPLSYMRARTQLEVHRCFSTSQLSSAVVDAHNCWFTRWYNSISHFTRWW